MLHLLPMLTAESFDKAELSLHMQEKSMDSGAGKLTADPGYSFSKTTLPCESAINGKSKPVFFVQRCVHVCVLTFFTLHFLEFTDLQSGVAMRKALVKATTFRDFLKLTGRTKLTPWPEVQAAAAE